MNKYGYNGLPGGDLNLLSDKIESLITMFSNKDGTKREKARLTVNIIGKPAVPFLLKALKDPSTVVRWEAAKALCAICDPRSGPDMVEALKDKQYEIRWLAAEGLIALKADAIKPLLKAIIEQPDSWELRQGAHHVLHALERDHILNKPCIDFLYILKELDQELSIPIAANNALKSL